MPHSIKIICSYRNRNLSSLPVQDQDFARPVGNRAFADHFCVLSNHFCVLSNKLVFSAHQNLASHALKIQADRSVDDGGVFHTVLQSAPKIAMHGLAKERKPLLNRGNPWHQASEAHRMAYRSSTQTRDQLKMKVFQSVAPGSAPRLRGRELYRFGTLSVHVRYCAPTGGNFRFNINPNTLRADYELWICGGEQHWYLTPVCVLRQMYEHPAAYQDSHHPEIRVVSVDALMHRASYASRSITLDLSPYFRAVLP